MDIQELVKIQEISQQIIHTTTDYLSYLQFKPSKYQKMKDETTLMLANQSFYAQETIISIPQIFFINKRQIPFYTSRFIKYLVRQASSDGRPHELKILLTGYRDIFTELQSRAQRRFPLQCFLYLIQSLWADDCPHSKEEVRYAHKKYIDYITHHHLHTPRRYIDHMENVNPSLYKFHRDLHEKQNIFIQALRTFFSSQKFQQFAIKNGISQLRQKMFSVQNLRYSLLLIMPRVNDLGIIPILDQIKHSDLANAKWVQNYDNNETCLVAIKDIDFQQEIGVCYSFPIPTQKIYSTYGYLSKNMAWEIEIPIKLGFNTINFLLSYPFAYYAPRSFARCMAQQLLNRIPKEVNTNKILNSLLDYLVKQFGIDRLCFLPFDAEYISRLDEYKFKKNMGKILQKEKYFIQKILENYQEIFSLAKRKRRYEKMLQ